MVVLKSKPKRKKKTPIRKRVVSNPVPDGLVLSLTGGKVFFSSDKEIVRLYKPCLDVDGLYKILEVDSHATEQEIKKAAKEALIENHPDHGGNEETFLEIFRAYEVLSDPLKRAEYDAKTNNEVVSVKTVKTTNPVLVEPEIITRCAYYKEPDIIMEETDESEVDTWVKYLLDAAYIRNMKMEIKAGIRKSVKNGYAVEFDVFTFQKGVKIERYMAHVLMELFKKSKEKTC